MKVRIGNDIKLLVQLADDTINILSLKAIIVNKTLKENFEKEYKKKNRFIHRFPIEPFNNEFKSTAYNINSAGYPRYRAFVLNRYNGFGVYPDWEKTKLVKQLDITEYTAEVERTENPSEVTVTFPAEAQKYNGVYDLIIIALLYTEGYKNNSRTATIDYSGVFELVSSSEESDIDDTEEINININLEEPSNDQQQ